MAHRLVASSCLNTTKTEFPTYVQDPKFTVNKWSIQPEHGRCRILFFTWRAMNKLLLLFGCLSKLQKTMSQKHILAILFLECLHIYMFMRQMSHSKTIQLAQKPKSPTKLQMRAALGWFVFTNNLTCTLWSVENETGSLGEICGYERMGLSPHNDSITNMCIYK